MSQRLRVCSFAVAFVVACLALCGCAPATPASHSISAEAVHDLMDRESDYLLIDVREQSEYANGHIDGAVCIPYTQIEANIDRLPDDKGALVIVYCASGSRSAKALKTLEDMGYANVFDMGGIDDWPYSVVEGSSAAGGTSRT